MARRARLPDGPISEDIEAILWAFVRLISRVKHIPMWVFASGSIALFAACFSATGRAADNIFCATSDDSIAVCARNWVNAIGTTVSSIIAIVAAAFVFQQIKISRRQANLAVVPSLDTRLEQIARIYKFVADAEDKLGSVWMNLETLNRHCDDDLSKLELANIYRALLKDLSNSFDEINVHTDNIKLEYQYYRLDADIRKIAEETVVKAELETIDGSGSIFAGSFFASDEEEMSDWHFMVRSVQIDIKTNPHICDEIEKRQDELTYFRETLSNLAKDTSNLKTEILNSFN